jgi:hypothetical protein
MHDKKPLNGLNLSMACWFRKILLMWQIMRKQVILLFIASLLFSFGNSGFGVTLKSTFFNELNNSEL